MDAMLKPLRAAFGDQLPSLLHLGEAIPDSGFADISHMNENGRTRFGPLLADAIRENRSARSGAN